MWAMLATHTVKASGDATDQHWVRLSWSNLTAEYCTPDPLARAGATVVS